MKSRYAVFLTLPIILFGIFVHTYIVEGIDLKKEVVTQLEAGASKTELGKPDPRLIVAGGIQFVLMFIGIVFVSLIIAAGYWRFTAYGEEEKIKKANKTMVGAVIGLAVVLSSYAITKFVAERAYNATQLEQGSGAGYEIKNQSPPSGEFGIPLLDL